MARKLIRKFNAREIVDEIIKKEWFQFQTHALDTGKAGLKYIQTYINTNRKRSGGKGRLASSMTLDILDTTGKIHWGLGHIPTLNKRAKYWYVTNYGKKVTGERFIPGGGKARPYKFNGNDADPSLRGVGTEGNASIKRIRNTNEPIPSAVRPMNYIEATATMINQHINKILERIRRT